MKASDLSCIPLCAECHRIGPDSYHRIKGGQAEFERRYGLDLEHLVKALNAEQPERQAP
jgi:hypothetical protein